MKHPAMLKSLSRRILFQMLFFSMLLGAILAYYFWQYRQLGAPITRLDYVALAGFVFFFGLLQWLFIKNTLKRWLADQPDRPKPQSERSSPTSPSKPDEASRTNERKRLFVHLFSVLQREGRLMDFLQEDLSRYEDDQIGAAVRGVHASCNKALARYISPAPVMQQNEGETVEIPTGFDRHLVKLTGNVVGEPPFKGILRHRGWQLKSMALPKLSDSDSADLIAPAEVEIQ